MNGIDCPACRQPIQAPPLGQRVLCPRCACRFTAPDEDAECEAASAARFRLLLLILEVAGAIAIGALFIWRGLQLQQLIR